MSRPANLQASATTTTTQVRPIRRKSLRSHQEVGPGRKWTSHALWWRRRWNPRTLWQPLTPSIEKAGPFALPHSTLQLALPSETQTDLVSAETLNRQCCATLSCCNASCRHDVNLLCKDWRPHVRSIYSFKYGPYWIMTWNHILQIAMQSGKDTDTTHEAIDIIGKEIA